MDQQLDAHDPQFREMRASIQRWEKSTTFNMSPSQYFPSLNHGDFSTPKPNAPPNLDDANHAQ